MVGGECSHHCAIPAAQMSSGIPRGGGGGGAVLKVETIEVKYEAKLEFLEGRGGVLQNKVTSVEGVWIFSGTMLTMHVQYYKRNYN